MPLGRIFLHTWCSMWMKKFLLYFTVEKCASVKKSTIILRQFFSSDSCCNSSIHPTSLNKTTYLTAERPFISLENFITKKGKAKRVRAKLVPSAIRTTTFAVFHLIKNGGGGIRTLRTERMWLVVRRLNHSATRSMTYYKHKQLYQQRS